MSFKFGVQPGDYVLNHRTMHAREIIEQMELFLRLATQRKSKGGYCARPRPILHLLPHHGLLVDFQLTLVRRHKLRRIKGEFSWKTGNTLNYTEFTESCQLAM